MYQIINILESILLNNENDSITLFSKSKIPIQEYLKCLEFMNEYRKQLGFDKFKFTYIECIANDYHLKLLTEEEYDYLFLKLNFNEKESVYIYNTLVSINYVKLLINSTWLEIILGHNGKFKKTFNLNSKTSIDTIIPLIMRCYTDVNDNNLKFLEAEYSQELKQFNIDENLISNKKLIIQFIKYIEDKSQCRVPVFIKCLLFNYQNINYYDNLNNVTNKFIGDIKSLSVTDNINNIQIHKSRFTIYCPIINYIISTLDNSIIEGLDEYLLNYYNRYNMYLENGLLFLGDCYEGMGYSTHFVYDLNINKFLMFNMFGSNGYDCDNNERLLQNYFSKTIQDKYIMLNKYISIYSNEMLVSKVFNNKYEFCFDNKNKYKLAFNLN